MNQPNETDGFSGQEARVSEFQAALIGWFEDGGESYPWRETTDPYAILVSELMLQQTRIATVLERGYFSRWMKKFPDWNALSMASEEDIMKAWEGLGYYNRARNLQKTARTVIEKHKGVFPRDLDEVLALPGVGKYTAGAVLSFAFNKPVPIVDGNVVRVLARVFAFSESVDSAAASRQIWNWAEFMTPQKEARSYNSAVMELGQKVCRKSRPLCNECPVLPFCKAAELGIAESLPVKAEKKAVTRKEECVFVIEKGDRVFLCPESSSRRKGLWRLPEVKREKVEDLSELFRFDYAITRFRVTLRVFQKKAAVSCEITKKSGRWYELGVPSEWPPLGSPYKKALLKYADFRNELIGKESFNE